MTKQNSINFDLLKDWMEKVGSLLDDIRFEKDSENYHKGESLELLVEDIFRWKL